MSSNINQEDNIIRYVAKFDEYGINIKDGGDSYIEIYFCPWCGKKLPGSRRDEWFERLDKLWYENPWNDDIPRKFKTDEWFNPKQDLH